MRFLRLLSVLLVLLVWAPANAVTPGRGLAVVGSIRFSGATDLDFRGNLAFVGDWEASENGGLYVVDISQPASPSVIGRFPCYGDQDDVGVWRDVVVMAMHYSDPSPGCATNGNGGLRLLDVSDPTNPTQTAFLQINTGIRFPGVHTLTVVGDTGYVYANPGGALFPDWITDTVDGGSPTTIVDIRDRSRPKVAGRFTPPHSAGCHDINVRGTRAYCAGSQVTQIWDITNPVRPVVVSTIVNPLITFHHGAAPSSDGKTLVIADENVYAQQCRSDGRSPLGAFWFYDISDESHPALKGWIGPVGRSTGPRVLPSFSNWCTAHNFNMLPGTNRMVAASYSAGTSVIDFGNPTSPRIVAWIRPARALTWSSYYHQGHIYTGDVRRGFDVIALQPG